MGIRFANGSRNHFIFALMGAMIAALFLSRAALSTCLVLFLAITILHKNFISQLQHFFKTPLLAGMAVLFLVPFVSGLWSSNVKQWSDLVRIKLPLLLLPLAFAGSWQLSQTQWRMLALFFILLMTAGTLWSFEKYWSDRAAVSASYLRAKVFLTPLQNDHVRYSWLVSVAALLCTFFIELTKGWRKAVACVVMLWLMVYLHVLAARTGLFSMYIMLLFYTLWKLVQHRNRGLVLITGIAIIALPLLAWTFLPTFQNRVKYFVYDYSFIKSGAYLPGGNDGNRMLSYRAGWHLLKTHPFGVGAGDVFAETDAWYGAHVPGMLAIDKLYPSSEWLLYGGSAGWLGVIVFSIVMGLPFFYKPPLHLFYWFALCGTAALSFLFDIGLEVQYGVFVYALMLLWWWKWFSVTSENVAS